MNEEIKSIPLEQIFKNIIPNIYVLHSTGGYHTFSQCSLDKKINEIYRKNIWPWVEVLKNNLNMRPHQIRYPSIGTRDNYPKLNLRVNGENKIYPSCKYGLYPTKTFYMHRMVALAFLKNDLDLPIVDHINCISTDYRINNLRWVSISDNNSNKNKNKLCIDSLYNTLKKQNLAH